MTSRLSREEFFDKLAGLDRTDLQKALWTLYWRGPEPIRERVLDLVDPKQATAREQAAKKLPDAVSVLREVEEFAELAKSGAYLGRDRRVSPKERTRWRLTFRRLAQQAEAALRGDNLEAAVEALTTLVDLACETARYDYFRSEDPMEAARFVVSDVVAAIWARLRDVYGATHMAEQAVGHLMSWESQYGWTRVGQGWVADRESTLTSTLATFLTLPDLWTTAAASYVQALERQHTRGVGRQTNHRDLSSWNRLLVEHLESSDEAELLATLRKIAGIR